MRKYLVLLLAVIFMFYTFNKSEAEEDLIPNDAIRFRIIANSNAIYDQNIKIQLRNVIQNKIFDLLNGTDDIDKTRKIMKENVKTLDALVDKTLKELNYDKKYKINYGYNYFPEKKYKGIKYKEGKYESLVITLGNGEGENFWCVLFPPLCLVEADDSKTTDAEYTFFVKEIIEKYIKK